MSTARSAVVSSLFFLAIVLGACGGDESGEAGDDSPPIPDAGSTSDAGSVDGNPIDARPAIDGDLFNDAGPLRVGTDFTLAEAQPAGLPAFGMQRIEAIGWLASEYLAIERSDGRHLVARRLSPEGQVVGTPLELASDLGEYDESGMVCSADRCLIVWSSVDASAAVKRMWAVILGPGLEVMTATPLAFGPVDHFGLAAMASGFMVARALHGDGLTLMTVDLNGDIAAQAPLFAGSFFSTFAEEGPFLACGANTCLVATMVCPADSNTCDRRLLVTDLTGHAVDPQGQLQDRLPQAFISTGSHLAAMYADGPHGPELVRLTDQGTPVGSPTVLDQSHQTPRGFFDGTAYLVLSEAFEDIHGPTTTTIERVIITRVAVDGTVLLDGMSAFDDAAGVHAYGAVAGCHDGQCLVAGVKSFGSIADYDAVVTRLNAGHSLDSAGTLVTTAAPAQLPSEVASNGSDFLVVWQQQAPEGDEVRARRINAEGTPSATSSQLVVASTTAAATALASNGDDYLFGWVNESDGKVRLVELDANGMPQGTPIELGQVNLKTYQWSSMGLACNTGQCLAAWTDDHVHVRRVRSDGMPVDSSDFVLQPRLSLVEVSVAYNQGRYAVAWVRNAGGSRDDLNVALVPEDGPIVAPATVVVEENISYFAGARVAASGDGFLVGWDGIAPTATAVNQLKLAELRGDGTLGPFAFQYGTGTAFPVLSPALVVNGQDVLIAGILPLGDFGDGFDTDASMQLQRVGAGPRMLDETPVDVGPVVFRYYAGVLGAANDQRDVLLVHQVFSNDVAHIGPHAVARLVKW